MHLAGPETPGAGDPGLSADERARIERFLALVGQRTLLAYYDIDPSTPADEVSRALAARRRWAQGQQANPKYKAEALWIIKQSGLLKRVLLDAPGAYLALLAEQERAQGLATLDQFLLGILAGGVLAAEAEQAVHQRGRALGLDTETIQLRIDHKLHETGARRVGGSEPALPRLDTWTADDGDSLSPADPGARGDGGLSGAPGPAEQTMPGFLDHYRTLDVAPDADLPSLEAALRARYRWARTITDPARSATIYDGLDEAWRVLRDEDRRARYDEERRAALLQGVPSLGDEDLPTNPGMPRPPEVEEELPTTIAPRPDLDIPAPSTAPEPAPVVDRRSDSRDLLLGPPSFEAPVNPDDLLLGPPPSTGGAHDAHPRLSGARARLSGTHPAPSGASQRASRSRPALSAPTLQRAEAPPVGPAPAAASSSTRERTWTGSDAGLNVSAARRSLPPVDTLGGQEPTREEPAVAEYSPSQSWGMYLAGALAVVAVWAILAAVFGWGRTEESGLAEPDAPLRAAAEAEAALEAGEPDAPGGVIAAGVGPGGEQGATPAATPPPVEAPAGAGGAPEAPSAEAPAGSAAGGDVPRDAAAAGSDAAPAMPPPTEPAAGADREPVAAEPVAAEPEAPEPVEPDAGEPEPVAPDPVEPDAIEPEPPEDPDAPDGYMGVPDF